LLVEKEKPFSKRSPAVAYVGGIAKIRAIKEIVNAISIVKSNKARLKLAGEFRQKILEQKIREEDGWDRVDFLGWQSRGEVAKLLSDVIAGLVLFYPEPNNIASQPNKLFEYMSAGLPVIASDFPLWREIIDGAGCGLLVDPLDVKAIAEAIQWMLEHPDQAEEMGKRGQKAIMEKYNWTIEEEKLLGLYKGLVE